ncbi:cystatin-B-like [Pagrus major]|uniref:cystatin-B-like n=1 Tax=Pagrus major TaxID=143350 RepID=UPI003CC88E61
MAYTEKWSKTLDATKDIQKLCDEVKSQVERKTDKKCEEFKAVKYRELTNIQFGVSFNWLIKLHPTYNGGTFQVYAVERMTNKKYQEFEAVLSRDQIVAGQNFLIKVRVGGDNYIHLLVYQTLPCNGGWLQLQSVQEDKTKDDPLEPFNN